MKRVEELGISPTPWRKAVNNFGMGENLILDRECHRVEYSGIDSCFSFENQTANLNMMVAAPKMYEACRMALSYIQEFPDSLSNDIREELECALAEASGEVTNG